MATTPNPPEYEITNEVRFAVVMYGGVSLAIYINGVAQELLRLVRSTARWEAQSGASYTLSGARATAPDARALEGTERVYRKLSYLLANGELLKEYRAGLDKAAADGGDPDAKLERLVTENEQPINTRFVVDILSGTSAGGINAVFLAKALANDQRIDDLKRLWVDEGDIDLLINDKKSYERTGLSQSGQPKSLLNSRRMYYKLLYALHRMDAPRRDGAKPTPSARKSPYAEEIDLFVTTTDIKGLTLPLKLADMVVYERRHRSVFHFRYSGKGDANDFANDFDKDFNPFLAFASRCTSSFPFAFEPMLLSDINQVLENREFRDYDNGDCRAESERWKRFFAEHLKSPSEAQRGAGGGAAMGPNGGAGGAEDFDFINRPYGDGGYLDNKPFSYATAALSRRHSQVPVDRKLIYVEPSPEHPEDEAPAPRGGARNGESDRPDALANVKAALIDLPSYETIREDLQRVLERNRFINRVNRIVSGIEDDVAKAEERAKRRVEEQTTDVGRTAALAEAERVRPARLKGGEWLNFDLADMARLYGVSFLPYHRLRIASVTDNIASLVADQQDFDTDSDQFLAVRSLVHAWRESAYIEYRPARADGEEGDVGRTDEGQWTLNRFLHDFDLAYQFRRLGFLRARIDQLYRCSHESTTAEPTLPKDRFSEELRGKLKTAGLDLRDALKRRSYQETLSFLKCRLNEFYDELAALDARLRTSPTAARLARAGSPDDGKAGPGLGELVGGLGLTEAHLEYVLNGKWEGVGPARQGIVEAEDEVVRCGEPNYAHQAECVRRARNLLDPQNAKIFGLEDLRERFGQAASWLAGQLDAVLRADNETGRRVNRTALILQLELDGAVMIKDECARGVDRARLNADYDAAVRLYLLEFYHGFDFYDQIGFPILYNTEVGEADPVEVIRVSPEDAPTLIDERDSGVKRRKLAGTSFHHFGAFLDRVWRENDIMWGRLDGVERLVSALLPGEENARVRAALIREAHTAILAEEMPQRSRDELTGLVVKSLQDAKAGASKSTQEAVDRIVGQMKKSSDFDSRLVSAMGGALTDGELLTYLGSAYEVNRQLDPKLMLRVMARSTQIIGKVFEGVADQNNLDGKHLRWVARLGQIFWGLVEVAVPHTLLNLLWSYWLKLLYAFWLVVILASVLFGSEPSRNFGLAALAVTGTLHAVSLVLRDLMRRRRRWLRAIASLVVLAILALAGYGGYGIYKLLNPDAEASAADTSASRARP